MSSLAPVRAWIARTSLAWRCTVLIVLVCAALIGPATGAAFAVYRAWQAQRTAAQTGVVLTWVGPERIRSADLAEDVREALAVRAGSVRWVGVVDADGACVELLRDTGVPLEAIVPQIGETADSGAPRPLILEQTASDRYELVAWRDASSTMTIAAIVDRAAAAPPVGELPRAELAAWGLAAAAGLVIALAWVRFAITRPLEALGRRLTIPHPGLLPSLPILAVPDELEGIACTVESLTRDVERWRVEAAYLRNTIETTVDARARSAELAADRARREADTDELTGIGNRRYLDRELPHIFSRQVERNAELALLVIDVDRFKQLNDKCGHQAGDQLLKFIGELLGSVTRRGTDLAARLGGDEFVVALPGLSADEAMNVGKRIAALFGQRAKTLTTLSPPPGLSIGIAARRQHGAATPPELLRMADVAMYFAKRSGRGVSTIPVRSSAATPLRTLPPRR